MYAAIKKAVFPVAGLGTRFLPATKANPKEMLPIVDKPLIQYAAEEAISAGITELIFVTSYAKRSIEDHFDSNFELEYNLEQKGRYELLALVKDILPKGVNCVYIRQRTPIGLGHAVLCAKDIVGNEPFAVLLADDLIDGGAQTCLERMVEKYQKTNSSIIALQNIAREDTRKYGIVQTLVDEHGMRIQSIIEKPEPKDAPSTLAAVGRYILTPKIFHLLETIGRGADNEIQLTDAIARLLLEEKIYGHTLVGTRYDCGSKLGYLKACVEFGLKHHEIGERFRTYLRGVEV